MKLNECLSKTSELVENWYSKNFSVSEEHLGFNLYNSMNYSLNAGGKRLRPALVLLGYNIVKDAGFTEKHPALPFAAGVEMIHTYSLIHDDLPCMDDDDMRRGKPTNHIVYGEALAVLAGDGLLTKAFEIFLNLAYYPEIEQSTLAQAAFEMAKGSGPDGMVGGQYVDMAAQGNPEDFPVNARLKTTKSGLDILKYIHTNKTAMLITKSLISGAILAGAGDDVIKNLTIYGIHLGLAFQITDDILDVTATTAELGKPAGSDAELDKLTYPKLLGLDEAKQEAVHIIEDHAIESISSYKGESADILRDLAVYILNRRS